MRQSGELPEAPLSRRHQSLRYEDVTKVHLRQMTIIHRSQLHQRKTVHLTDVGKDDRKEYDQPSYTVRENLSLRVVLVT